MTPRIEHIAEGVTLYLGDCRKADAPPLYESISSHDGCARLVRRYGVSWQPDEIARFRRLEAAGLMRFVDLFNLVGDVVRRSTITGCGMVAINVTRVFGFRTAFKDPPFILPDIERPAPAKQEAML